MAILPNYGSFTGSVVPWNSTFSIYIMSYSNNDRFMPYVFSQTEQTHIVFDSSALSVERKNGTCGRLSHA